jgi:GrpB-like predicted nucleotidyltransferase (UPF0157 family)
MTRSDDKDASLLQGPDVEAHAAFMSLIARRKSSPDLDEPISLRSASPEWPMWFHHEAERLRASLPYGVAPEIQHIGSTAVPGLDAKPIIDLMIGLSEPRRIDELVDRLEREGYESLGEAGVPGRWAIRRRGGSQHYNISIIAFDGERGRLNIAIREFLRTDSGATQNYALAKWRAVENGANMLFAYSDAKRAVIEAIAARLRGLTRPA